MCFLKFYLFNLISGVIFSATFIRQLNAWNEQNENRDCLLSLYLSACKVIEKRDSAKNLSNDRINKTIPVI